MDRIYDAAGEVKKTQLIRGLRGLTNCARKSTGGINDVRSVF